MRPETQKKVAKAKELVAMGLTVEQACRAAQTSIVSYYDRAAKRAVRDTATVINADELEQARRLADEPQMITVPIKVGPDVAHKNIEITIWIKHEPNQGLTIHQRDL